MLIQQDLDLTSYNTFGIHAKTDYLAEFNTEKELIQILQSNYGKLPKLVLGGGSNILFTENFRGIILLNRIKGIRKIKEDEQHVWVKAGAGEHWHQLVLYALDQNLGGIENLSLIPGTVGAAPIQNIGAYGSELKDVFEELEALEIETLISRKFTSQACDFGYRQSVFKKTLKDRYIITQVTLRLNKFPVFNIQYGSIKDTMQQLGLEELNIRNISQAIIYIRKNKLPDPAETGNAGSFFKNPEINEDQFNHLKALNGQIPYFPGTSTGYIKIPAAWLIEQCGWKGKKIGDAGVHQNQALVLVNYGNAQGIDIKNLSRDIQDSVRQKFGIFLETEVNMI